MDSFSLLRRQAIAEFTPEEEVALARELSDAYHMDESATSSRDVQRIGEKVRIRIQAQVEGVTRDPSSPSKP